MTAVLDRLNSPSTLDPADWRFTVVGYDATQLILRGLGLFAQRDLVPQQLTASRHDDMITIIVDQDGLGSDRADVLLEKIRAIPSVESASRSSR